VNDHRRESIIRAPSVGPQATTNQGDGDPVAEATEAFRLLLKGIKNIGIYKHADTRYAEFMEPAFRALSAFLKRYESLPLRLEPFALKYRGEAIYEDQDRENLTYKFYRDGVRYLVFRAGLPMQELLGFVLLSMENLKDSQLFQEDMVTRLWKQEFQFIEHIVVEGFGFGDLSEEEVEVEVDKVIGYLRKQLAANSDDIARFARLSLEDLELQMSEIEQVRGGIISGRPARPDDKAALQDAIVFENKNLTFTKTTLILFQILEHDFEASDFDMITEALDRILDTSILTEDIKGALALPRRFQQILERDVPPDRRVMIDQLYEGIREKMIEPHRLEAIANYLNVTREIDQESVLRYLDACREDQVPLLLDLLSRAGRTEARRVWIEVIAGRVSKQMSLVAEQLENGSTNTVRDMLAIVEKVNPPNRLAIVSKTMRHKQLGVRLEGLKQLARSSEPEALRYIERAANDSDLQIRLGAYRALVQRAPRRATEFFIKQVRSEHFENKDQREKSAIFVALGQTKTDGALKMMKSAFEQKSGFFQRSKVDDLKHLAITGLSALGTLDAFKVLKSEVQNRNNSKEVMLAAREAALKLRERLGGSQGTGNLHPPTGDLEGAS